MAATGEWKEGLYVARTVVVRCRQGGREPWVGQHLLHAGARGRVRVRHVGEEGVAGDPDRRGGEAGGGEQLCRGRGKGVW